MMNLVLGGVLRHSGCTSLYPVGAAVLTRCRSLQATSSGRLRSCQKVWELKPFTAVPVVASLSASPTNPLPGRHAHQLSGYHTHGLPGYHTRCSSHRYMQPRGSCRTLPPVSSAGYWLRSNDTGGLRRNGSGADGTLGRRGLTAFSLQEAVDDFEGTDDEETEFVAPDAFPLPDRIGFIGAGQMGEALIRGFTSAGVAAREGMCASVKDVPRQRAMTALGLRVFGDALKGGAEEVAHNSDIIFLGVKPQYMRGVLAALGPHVGPQHLVVSIAAGITLHTLEQALPQGVRLVRVMPNTPCLVGQAASGYVLGRHCTVEDGTKTHALLSAVGIAMLVEERHMDAVTALSGSGPAYVFTVIEALADGGVAAGLPRDKALALAAQTVVGAGKMIFERLEDGSLSHPAILRDRVTSPGGTTIAGLMELEAAGVRGAFMRAVQAAAERSKQLG